MNSTFEESLPRRRFGVLSSEFQDHGIQPSIHDPERRCSNHAKTPLQALPGLEILVHPSFRQKTRAPKFSRKANFYHGRF